MEIIFRLVNMQLLIQDKKSSQEWIARNDGTFHTSLQSGTNEESSAFQTKKSSLEQKQKLNEMSLLRKQMKYIEPQTLRWTTSRESEFSKIQDGSDAGDPWTTPRKGIPRALT